MKNILKPSAFNHASLAQKTAQNRAQPENPSLSNNASRTFNTDIKAYKTSMADLEAGDEHQPSKRLQTYFKDLRHNQSIYKQLFENSRKWQMLHKSRADKMDSRADLRASLQHNFSELQLMPQSKILVYDQMFKNRGQVAQISHK